jgi:hypothetical protein
MADSVALALDVAEVATKPSVASIRKTTPAADIVNRLRAKRAAD